MVIADHYDGKTHVIHHFRDIPDSERAAAIERARLKFEEILGRKVTVPDEKKQGILNFFKGRGISEP